MSSSRKRIGLGLTAAALLSSGFVAAPSPALANPAGTGLVINEVYGGGGNSGGAYRSDFIELYNPTGAAISLSGKSLQYRSASGGVGGTAALTGSVASHGYFLIKAADGSDATQPALPTPDATTTLALSGTGGQVLLINGSSFTGSGDLAGNANLVDMVGWGSSTTSFEGTVAPATTNGTSVTRTNGADTDKNGTDFKTATPVAQNSGSTGGGGTDPGDPGTPSTKTIAEIQGTGTASPEVGNTVTTTGVVTASYPTGGFTGFYLQTGGTGGATDATPGASDAVFVYTPSLAAGSYPAVGASLQVTGSVSEFSNLTELTATASGITSIAALPAVTPLSTAYPTTATAREAHEGELLAPTDTFTVSDTYDMNSFAEIGLATGTTPLVQPTEVKDASDTAGLAQVVADNAARGVILSDASSLNYFTSATGKATPLPWLTKTSSVSVGARATFHKPVVLDFRNGLWNFQPQQQVTGTGADVVTFSDQRAANAEPQDVGGNVRLATFNVLNYFPTTADEFVANGGSCTYYDDRAGNHITANSCTPDGPRGAANAANLKRQQDKIVAAINHLGAGIVSLEEIENSVKFGKARDAALQTLVTALNADAGAGTWAFAPSPAAADLPATSAQDVIRTAFIYKPAEVSLVGASKVLVGSSAFSNARQPLAQAFKKAGAPDSDAFAVVVNHFKSKGSGSDDGTGQGLSNADRVAQANALVTFANQFASDRGTAKVFLTGDFNAYSMEDPMQVLADAGYTDLRKEFDPNTATYSFDGLAGSLDHVLANAAALDDVTGADVWSINSGEPISYEYSRYNYNVSDLYSADQYRASDHDPLVVGLDLAAPATTVPVNLLNINDFHGRIDANTTKFATTVEQLRAAAGDDHTLLLSAGDNIGASLFASSSADDNPTIDVLDALDMAASAVGNHEFDRGYDDLTGRVQDRADWSYLGANVYHEGTEDPALPEYDTFDVDGVTVGVIGVVTQETPSLVSPAGVAGLDFGDPVEAVNRVAGELSDGDPSNGEADVIVAEYHEGAGSNLPDTATCSDEIAADTVFGKIARTTSADVDVIFTGHTHKTYACNGPVPGSPSKTRPILQTGEYGGNIGQVQLDVDATTGDVVSYTQRNVARVAAEDTTYPRVQQVKQITDAALAAAATLGNQPVATITKDITTAFSGGSYGANGYTGGSRDDRASESTLGDLVAQALKDGVSGFAQPDLGITNPGGLRDELRYAGNTTGNAANTDGVVTYAEANSVLPFNNTVAIVKLTGAQLKQVLEQQWQTNPDGSVPSRPYLQLGLSDNVRVTADPSKPAGSRITSVRINGELLDPGTTYTVSTLSFLATGGDNFRAFTQGSYVDTGLLDAQLWRDYLSDNSPVAPDFARQQVQESGMPATVTASQNVSFTLSKLDLTSLGSPQNQRVRVFLGQGTERRAIGTFPVSNGTATISFTAPANLIGGWQVGVAAEPSSTRVGFGGTVPAAPSIAGTVKDSTGSPIAGACVYLYTARNAANASYASCTQNDGSYYVSVSAGTYYVAVADGTGQHDTTWLDSPVTANEPVTGVDVVMADLQDAAAIDGTVTDEVSGDGLDTVCVFAYEDGNTGSASYGTCTNDDGSYGIYPMERGSYDVAFFDTTGEHLTEWWNGTEDGAATQAGAVAVSLPNRTSTATADASMNGETTGVVSGQVTNQAGNPVEGVCVYLYTNPAGPAAYATCTQADGTWYLGAVAPGTDYKVGFADGSGTYATQWWTGSDGGAATYAGGTTIGPVTAGHTTSGIDAKMRPVS